MVSCQVWFADIGLERAAHLDLLNDVERDRRAQYRQDVDRSRFTVAASLLRLVVAAETGTDPAAVRVDRSCYRCALPHGKPQIPDTDLHVSISHSGDMVAFALTREAAIGVDVEVIVPARDVVGLARTVLTEAEPIDRTEDFYTYWCRKEAIVKATGDGLRVPLVEVVVSPAGEPARLVSYRGTDLIASMSDLAFVPGYAAAVAVLAPGELDVRVQHAAAVMAIK